MDDKGPFEILVTEDGGITKKILAPGKEGEEAPPTDGSFKVKAAFRMWYLHPEKGSRRMVLEPDEVMTHLSWMLFGKFNKPEQEPPPCADLCLASMRTGEKALFRVEPKYAYGAEGGTVKNTKPLKYVPPNTVLYCEVEVVRMRKPRPKRWQIGNQERIKRATACKERGVELFKEGRFQEAVKQFRDCSDYSSMVTPTENREFVATVRVPGCLNAAVCCMKLEKWKEALGHADDALKMDYDNIKGLYLRAQALEKLNRKEDALSAIIKAVKADPTSKLVRDEYHRIKEALGPVKDSTKEAFKKVFRGDIYENHVTTAWIAITTIFAELVYGFLFWSLFATLGAQIWFFPLEYMDVTGYEVIVVAVFAPALLGFARVMSFSQRQSLHIAAAVGLIMAFKIKYLLPRTAVLGLATALSLLATGARFSQSFKWLGVSGVLVGLDRLWGYSRSSMWTDQTANAFLLFFVCVAYRWGNPAREADASKRFSPIVPLSLGSLLFLMQWFVLQPTVWSRWIGFPVMPLALLVATASIAGFCVPRPTSLVFGRALAVLPVLSASWVLSFPSQIGVSLFVFSVCALWRPTVENASGRPHGSTLFCTLLVWFLHFLASIWTVAYNFVPFGGALMRERTDVHLLVTAAVAGLVALVTPRSLTKRGAETAVMRRRFVILGVILMLILAPIAVVRVHHALQVPYQASRQARADGGEIRSMIWAVHFGYDNFGRNSFDEIERTIVENKVNVIGLLESDLTRPFTDNWDVVDYLSTRLGMHSDFGPSTLNNTWGCALLSVYPIVHVERWMLPSPEGELACILDATLDVLGRRVQVVVTHFGNDRDVLDRQLQADGVADLIRRADKDLPHIFLGYLTNRPYSSHYNQLVAAGWVDVAPHEMRRWCQYIFYRNLTLVSFSRYDTGDTSDTEAQIAVFRK